MQLFFYLTVAVLLFALPAQVSAANFTIGSWQATGYQMWRTSFPTATNTSNERGASELSYPQTGTYIVGSYENSLSSKRALRVETGIMNTINPAIGSDSDWEKQSDTAKWYYGEFTSSGSSMFFNVDWVQKENTHLERYYGYGYRDNRYTMTDGTYYLNDKVPQSPPLQLASLNSTYKMIYQGPHIGWKYTASSRGKLTPIISLTYTPLAYVHGRGWWNLRDLAFTHNGPGQMLDASLAVRYAPNDSANIVIGYRYQYNSLFHGWEDTNQDISWDKADNIQQGFYFSACLPL